MNPQDSDKAQFSMPLPPIPPPFKINNANKSKELQERPESRRSRRNPSTSNPTPATTPRNGFITNDDDEWSRKVGFNTDNDKFH